MDYQRILLVIAALVLLFLVVKRFIHAFGSEAPGDDAPTRARRIAETALQAYRHAESHDPSVSAEERRVRALIACSGESEAQARERIEKAKELSALHTTLQVLIVGVAARRERELADQVGSAQLMRNTVDAQKTVMAMIPRDL